jgi:RHS repeat-associated protein
MGRQTFLGKNINCLGFGFEPVINLGLVCQSLPCDSFSCAGDVCSPITSSIRWLFIEAAHCNEVPWTADIRLVTSNIEAQCGNLPPPIYKDLGCPSNPDGNPCNPANGNKYQHEIDYQSNNGTLGIVRHYNSRASHIGPLGSSWTTSFHRRLEISGTTVQLRRPDGSGEPFSCPTSGACQGDIDTQLQLTKDAGGFSLTLRDNTTERYSLTGRLLSETDSSGNTSTYSYGAGGRLSTVTDFFGHALIFSYDSSNRISTISNPLSQAITYSYGGINNLTRVNYPDNTAKIYHYENPRFPNHLTGISYVDAGELTTRFSTYTYDATGKAIRTEHAQTDNGAPQEKFSLNYDSATQTTVTDPVGINEIMTFSANLGVKNLTNKVNLSDSKSVEQTFDANNNLTCRKDEEGRVTTYTYNAANQRTGMTEGQIGDCASPGATSATRTTAYQYLSATLDLPTVIQSPSVTAGQNKTTTIQYNDAAHPNLPTLITQNGFTPAGAAVARTVTLGYNALGQVILINGPRTDVSDITTLEYNECTTGGTCGQLKKVTNALGHITTYDLYDANGRVTQVTDPNSLRTNYSYDARGRVRFITQTPSVGSARTTEYRYTAFGEVQTAIMPDGVTLTYGYDAALYLRSITDNLGNRVTYHYDLKGNRDGEDTTDPSGTLVRSVSYAYDLRNRLSTITAAGSVTQQIHDAVGNLLQEIDPNNNPATQHTPDALNRLVQTVDRLSGITAYAYDRNDRVTQLQAPNGSTTGLVYDDLGNLLQEASPDRGTTNYTYDAAGNLLALTDARGITITYTYDALNRVTAIDYPGTLEDVTFTYDTGTACSSGIGRLCLVQDESGTTNYAYDAFGNILQQTHVELGITYTTAYTYDAADRVMSMTYPSGRVVTYTRDVLGRISGVTTTLNGATATLASNMTYRADGLLTGQSLGNGLAEVRQHDLQGRLTYLSLGSADTRLFGYDANSNLTSAQSLPQVANYGYDALDWLIQDSVTTATTTINNLTYDANGNRLSDSRGTYIYLAASNRLTTAPDGGVAHDAAGNTLSDGSGRTFSYNAAGRLVQGLTNDTEGGSYVYNAQGQRTRKIAAGGSTQPSHPSCKEKAKPGKKPKKPKKHCNPVQGGSGTTVYHYDLTGHLIGETTEIGESITDYVYAGATPLAQLNRDGLTDTLTYLHTDHLNTPRFATNPSGTVVWRWDGGAFGETAPNQDPDGDGNLTTVNLRYPGQYYDSETGLYYNWHRYYDPKTGRYISSDPIGLVGGLNTYAYVGNNPLRWTDPRGLDNASGGTWNGNLIPGFTRQDNVCTLGPLSSAANSNPCVRQCCVLHDVCYKANQCNASSWLLTGPVTATRCATCNWIGMMCALSSPTRDCEPCKANKN